MIDNDANGKPRNRTGTWVAAGVLVVAVLATGGYLWWALSDWGLGGIGLHGMLALILGGLGTLALTGGLMFLLFWSARSGHDDLAHDDWSHDGRGYPGPPTDNARPDASVKQPAADSDRPRDPATGPGWSDRHDATARSDGPDRPAETDRSDDRAGPADRPPPGRSP